MQTVQNSWLLLRTIVASRWLIQGLVWGLMACETGVAAGPAQSSNANEAVIETLPVQGRQLLAERQLRQQLNEHPQNARAAVALASKLLEQSRRDGDPRPVGQALAALQPWSDASTAPADVLLMRATLQQHVHDFDAARINLERLVQRQPQHAQAWLTLATLHRVQGRLLESSRACKSVFAAGAQWHGEACLAENAGLQGQIKTARTELNRLSQDARATAGQQAWLLTTLAELEGRSGQPREAEHAYRRALSLSDDGYTRLSYADFLLAQHRPADAWNLLQSQPRSDNVLLRLAAAGLQLNKPQAAQDRLELTARFSRSPGSEKERLGHAREQALFSLWIERDARKALYWARLNLSLQREPIDWWLMAEAARSSGDSAALNELRQLKKDMGLKSPREGEINAAL